MWTLNDHVAPLYAGMVRDLDVDFHTCFEAPVDQVPDFKHTFDVNAAFKLSDQKKQHLAKSYADLLGVEIGDQKSDLKPIYIPVDDGTVPLKEDLVNSLEGCILVSMFSASCTGRDPKCNYIPNKMLPWEKWKPMLDFLRIHFPETPIRFLGAPTDETPSILGGYGVTMLGIPLNRLALIMHSAKLLVTIDNGMSHLGASQELCTYLMYPKALGLHYILPIGNPNLVFVHMNPVTVDPAYLLNGLQYAVGKFEKTVWIGKQIKGLSPAMRRVLKEIDK
jgi:ADP-heptose:LPS heptosyltransferase